MTLPDTSVEGWDFVAVILAVVVFVNSEPLAVLNGCRTDGLLIEPCGISRGRTAPTPDASGGQRDLLAVVLALALLYESVHRELIGVGLPFDWLQLLGEAVPVDHEARADG